MSTSDKFSWSLSSDSSDDNFEPKQDNSTEINQTNSNFISPTKTGITKSNKSALTALIAEKGLVKEVPQVKEAVPQAKEKSDTFRIRTIRTKDQEENLMLMEFDIEKLYDEYVKTPDGPYKNRLKEKLKQVFENEQFSASGRRVLGNGRVEFIAPDTSFIPDGSFTPFAREIGLDSEALQRIRSKRRNDKIKSIIGLGGTHRNKRIHHNKKHKTKKQKNKKTITRKAKHGRKYNKSKKYKR
jgi:hypothetical protein